VVLSLEFHPEKLQQAVTVDVFILSLCNANVNCIVNTKKWKYNLMFC
jgi:hypothetical protein